MIYRIQFIAVRKGAIGSTEEYVRTVHAKSKDKAIRLLYTWFDHIHVVSIKEMRS